MFIQTKTDIEEPLVCIWFQVFMVVKIWIVVFWVRALWSGSFFEVIYCLKFHLYREDRSSKLITTYKSTQCHNLEDHDSRTVFTSFTFNFSLILPTKTYAFVKVQMVSWVQNNYINVITTSIHSWTYLLYKSFKMWLSFLNTLYF